MVTQIEVPVKFAADLNELASRDERAVQDLVSEAIGTYLAARLVESPLSPLQVERLSHSLAQAQRGELIPQEEVEAFFDDWEKDVAAR